MKQLPRRTFLQGVGSALSLPLLEAMLPTNATAASVAASQPKRMAYIFFPNGAIMEHWSPKKEGSNYDLTKSLAPLKDVKDDVLVLSGLSHDKAKSNGDGGGDHARNSGSFLTASQPKKTGGADIKVGISADQVAAAEFGDATRLPSLEIGIEPGRRAGKCDSGYSCAYTSNISWKSPSQPMAKEIQPKLAFERLFGKASKNERKQQERDFYRKSILDLVSDDASKLNKKLGSTDRRKIDEYFSSVRDIEKRIARIDDNAKPAPELDLPTGVPKDFVEHIRLMYELLLVAFQTDSTRIATYMLADAGTNRSYRNVGVKGGHHQLSHHRGSKEKKNEIQRIDQFLVGEFAKFLGKMKTSKEGEGNLLDSSMIVLGSGISDADRHRHHDLPVLLAGKAGGGFKTGRHIRYKENTPMANLYVSLLNEFGVKIDRFGDSSGALPNLKG